MCLHANELYMWKKKSTYILATKVTPFDWLQYLTGAVVCFPFALFATQLHVCLRRLCWHTLSHQKDCRVSGGMVMNGSVVTSQVQLPLCLLYAACSPIIPQTSHVWSLYTKDGVWMFCLYQCKLNTLKGIVISYNINCISSSLKLFSLCL